MGAGKGDNPTTELDKRGQALFSCQKTKKVLRMADEKSKNLTGAAWGGQLPRSGERAESARSRCTGKSGERAGKDRSAKGSKGTGIQW